MFPILAIASIFLQIVCVLHAWNKRVNYFWIAAIVLIPVGGCLAYIVIEWLPATRLRAGLESAADLDEPVVDIETLRAAVDREDTRHNRQALARGYSAIGEYENAIAQYEKCLDAAAGGLPLLRMEFAFVELKAKRYESAKKRLEALEESHPLESPARRKLLLAQALEQLGELERAAKILRGLLPESQGEEITCRLALVEKKLKNEPEAARLFEKVLTRAAQASRIYRREQRDWIEIAAEAAEERKR